jgi:hypothetical protein
LIKNRNRLSFLFFSVAPCLSFDFPLLGTKILGTAFIRSVLMKWTCNINHCHMTTYRFGLLKMCLPNTIHFWSERTQWQLPKSECMKHSGQSLGYTTPAATEMIILHFSKALSLSLRLEGAMHWGNIRHYISMYMTVNKEQIPRSL